MYHDFNYERTLASSLRAQWMLDDVLRENEDLDFTRNFMPESLARTAALGSLNPVEQRVLNQISAHQYLSIFGIVEEFILPFLLDHARQVVREDDWRIRALLNFAGEEAKHIHLFKRFHAALVRGFPVECQVIGPSDVISAEVLRHDPLAVALLILMIEWMTQQHYLGSIRDDGDLAKGRTEEQFERAIDEFFEIGAFLDEGLKTQAGFNVDALETAIGRKVENRDAIIAEQHQAARWTYIGSGMVHERFKDSLESLSPVAAWRIADAAPHFA